MTIEDHVDALVDNETHGYCVDESTLRIIDGHELLYRRYGHHGRPSFYLFCMKPAGQDQYFGYLGEGSCSHSFLWRFLTQSDSNHFGVGFELGTLPMVVVYEREHETDTDWVRAASTTRCLLGSEISPFPSRRFVLPFTRS